MKADRMTDTKPNPTEATSAMSPRTIESRPGKLALRVLDGAMSGSTFEITKPSIKVGRGPGPDIVIAHHSISKIHFSMRAVGNGAEVKDLGSKNGLWLGGRRIFHAGIVPGDVLAAGECRIELLAADSVNVEVSVSNHCGLLHGKSVVMRELFARIEQIAPVPLDVLIQGETGTGKEQVARTLHDLSPRRTQPLVVLDCANLPTTLAEATLFGFRKGAFTGADYEQPGLFEQANGGTMFIDEIGELPPALQTRLLRVLDRREVSRLGEPGKVRTVDVRVIAATNRDLQEEVQTGNFREDLYHRLSQEVFTLPPLRERERDVVELADVLVAEFGRQYQLSVTLGEDARGVLLLHTWPGNVRELRNLIRRAVLLRRSGKIGASDLGFGRLDATSAKVGSILGSDRSYRDAHLEFDRLFMPAVLDEVDGNLSKAAARLGISRDRLRGRLKELGLYAINDDGHTDVVPGS